MCDERVNRKDALTTAWIALTGQGLSLPPVTEGKVFKITSLYLQLKRQPYTTLSLFKTEIISRCPIYFHVAPQKLTSTYHSIHVIGFPFLPSPEKCTDKDLTNAILDVEDLVKAGNKKRYTV